MTFRGEYAMLWIMLMLDAEREKSTHACLDSPAQDMVWGRMERRPLFRRGRGRLVGGVGACEFWC